MNNDEWKKVVEEFGDRAFERVDGVTSAALPFDLERATIGDVVEGLIKGEWIIMTIHPNAFFYIPESEYKNLRMKYPPKKLQSNCQTCQFTDVCEHASVQHLKLLPLTQRGNKPHCFVCGHRYWNINNVTHVHKCMDCAHTVTGVSVDIKHQR